MASIHWRLKARFGTVLLLQFGLLIWLVAFDTGRDIHAPLDVTSVVIPLFSISVATDRRLYRRIALALALAAFAFSGGALSGFRPANLDVGPILASLFSAFATWVLLMRVVRSRRVTADVLGGALAAYVMAGLAFSVVFGVIEVHAPDAFRGAGGASVSFSDLVYFSFVSLLTIGFGDVTPVAPLARAVVLLEGLFGVIYTTIVMAALVAGYLRNRPEEVGPDESARQ